MSELINRFLDENRKNTVNLYCVGDCIIDEYWNAKVNRISPEFPMPIVHVKDKEATYRPGGVSNVAYQTKYFNVDAHLITLLDDLSVEVMEKHSIGTSKSCFVKDCIVPVKKRFLDNGIQVARIDHEEIGYYLSENRLKNHIRALIDECSNIEAGSVVVLSDYNKGLFFDPQLFLEQLKDTITIVDPKKGPIDKWKGCTIFKPNSVEAKALSGLDSWKDQCQYFQGILNCKSVIITQGGEGVVGIDGNEFFEYHPNQSVLVESMIGAGDCFIATLAMAICRGFKSSEAAEIAFQAGTIYVQNRMNRPIVPAELSPIKYVAPEDLRNRDFKLIFTNGCFDFGLTGAHVECLKEAKSYGDKLIVALNSDESVRKLKGPNRPIIDLKERMEIISSLDCVDFVTSFDEDTPLEIIKKIMPDMVCKGYDYKPEDVAGYGIVHIQITKKYDYPSTTEKLKKMNL